jgi:hypothetical protein
MSSTSKSLAAQLRATIELRQGGIITESEIRACRGVLNRVEHAPGLVSELTKEIADWITCEMPVMRVEDAMAARGYAWLRKLLFTPKGEIRKTVLTSEIAPSRHQRLRHVMETYDHFKLADFEWVGDARGRWYPQYIVVAKNGECFEYVAIPWQSGTPIFRV